MRPALNEIHCFNKGRQEKTTLHVQKGQYVDLDRRGTVIIPK